MNRRLGILISGRGSNLQSIIDAIARGELSAEIAVVISNRPEAAGLLRAREAGLETVCLRQKDFDSRDTYDAAIARELEQRKVGLVCLAGFMRLVGRSLLNAFPQRILNIHPSLLPAFPGLEAQRQAFEYGVGVTGVWAAAAASGLGLVSAGIWAIAPAPNISAPASAATIERIRMKLSPYGRGLEVTAVAT